MKYMTNTDRQELKEMINDVVSIHSEKTQGQFNLIQQKLESIEEQTKKTNGRVTRLESDTLRLQFNDSNHGNTCPQGKRIEALEKDSITSKGIKKFLIGGIGLIVMISSIAIAVFELFIKQT